MFLTIIFWVCVGFVVVCVLWLLCATILTLFGKIDWE